MLRKFLSDPYFFTRYCGISLAVFLCIDTVLFLIRPTESYAIRVEPRHLAMIPLGMYLGVLSAVWIHNASHNSAGPRWLNAIVGEACGTHQLHGLMGWKIAHLIHHKYPDNPEFDPHPPGEMGFWPYMLGMRGGLFKCLHNAYVRQFGDSPRFRRITRIKNALGLMATFARIAFWVLLLGPTLFLFLYVPSYVANYLFFSHLNYASHRPSADGAEILNLNHNLYYRIMNRLFSGMYFHKNHHLNPSYANPMRIPLTRLQPTEAGTNAGQERVEESSAV